MALASLDFLRNALQSLGECCPVLGENFAVSNPPYKTDHCGHRFSLQALENLDLYIFKTRLGISCAFNYCPLCRQRITFAFLDLEYLRSILTQHLLSDDSKESLSDLKTNISRINTNNAHIYAPNGGLHSILKQLGCE